MCGKDSYHKNGEHLAIERSKSFEASKYNLLCTEEITGDYSVTFSQDSQCHNNLSVSSKRLCCMKWMAWLYDT